MNFLEHYLNYAEVNESPSNYHLWSGLSLISHIMGRRVWTHEGRWNLYPNMYVCLVGPPGIAKSTAMNTAKDLFKEGFPNVFCAPASITKEAIVQTMAKAQDSGCEVTYAHDGKMKKFSQMSIFANEFVSLLSAGGNPLGMIEFFTDIWDVDSFREKTKNKGDNTIHFPFINVLACFTTDTARMLMQSKIITGGMSRRCLFVYADKNKKAVPRIRYTDEQIKSYKTCLAMGQIMSRTTGEFTWTKEADDYYCTWYEENFARADKVTSDVLKHFLRSAAGYATKISMLLAMAEENPKTEHTLQTISKATTYIRSVENGACILFDGGGRNELTALAASVEKFLITLGVAINLKALRAHFWQELKGGDPKELDTVLDHLAQKGIIKIRGTLEGGGNKIIEYIKP